MGVRTHKVNVSEPQIAFISAFATMSKARGTLRSAPDNYAEPDFSYRLILFRGQTANSNPSERAPVRGRDRHPALQREEVRVAELDCRASHTLQTFSIRLRIAPGPRRSVGLLARDGLRLRRALVHPCKGNQFT